MPRLTALLVYGDLLQHRNYMFNHHLPGIDPALKSVQWLLIATNIWKVTVEMRRDMEAKALAHKVDAGKGILDILVSNLT